MLSTRGLVVPGARRNLSGFLSSPFLLTIGDLRFCLRKGILLHFGVATQSGVVIYTSAHVGGQFNAPAVHQ